MQVSKAATIDTALNATGITVWPLLTQPEARAGNRSLEGGSRVSSTVLREIREAHKDIRFVGEARILGREVKPVRTGIDLEEAAGQFRVLDNALDIELITRPLEEKAAGRMPENVEVAAMISLLI